MPRQFPIDVPQYVQLRTMLDSVVSGALRFYLDPLEFDRQKENYNSIGGRSVEGGLLGRPSVGRSSWDKEGGTVTMTDPTATEDPIGRLFRRHDGRCHPAPSAACLVVS